MHNFDRGIIKWLPFDALTGFKESISVLKEKRNNIDKPILSIDQLEVLDQNLKKAYYENIDITLYYYEKGRIYYVVGKITKIDYIYKKIKVEHKWLNSNKIIKLELKN